jgi:predicted enzyme related to lactoylglutathione lyase
MVERDGFAHGTPGWVDIGSTDLDKTHAFYSGLFGWDRQEAGPIEETGGYGFYTKGGKLIAGYGPAQDPSGGVWWTTYVIVDSAADVAGKAEANGGQVIVPPMEVMTAGTMAIFTDPEGAAIAAWQPRDHKGAQLVNEPGALSWNELNTRDLPRAIAFYEAVFGWGEKNGVDTQYAEFTVQDNVIAGGMPMPDMVPADVPAFWNVYFGVANADESAAQVTDLGGTVMVAPFDIPDVGRAAVCLGPTGEAFSIFQL